MQGRGQRAGLLGQGRAGQGRAGSIKIEPRLELD